MAKINLLPWRETLRKEKQQEFFVMLGFFSLAAAIVVGLVHVYHSQLIESQQARNRFLEDQITQIDKKIKEIQELEAEKQKLLDRMRAIEQLQGNRPLIVRFFDELVTNLPEGVSITSIAQKGKDITIDGEAQSNARVSSFMRNLEKSKWLAKPKLNIIQAKSAKGNRLSTFKLKFKQVIPKTEAEEDA